MPVVAASKVDKKVVASVEQFEPHPNELIQLHRHAVKSMSGLFA